MGTLASKFDLLESINLNCLKVDALIKSGVKIEKVVVSPMTRTLQTAWGTFNGYNIPFQVKTYL